MERLSNFYNYSFYLLVQSCYYFYLTFFHDCLYIKILFNLNILLHSKNELSKSRRMKSNSQDKIFKNKIQKKYFHILIKKMILLDLNQKVIECLLSFYTQNYINPLVDLVCLKQELRFANHLWPVGNFNADPWNLCRLYINK